MSFMSAIHDHKPYEANTVEGFRTSMAKRALIGVVVSALVAVGYYYLAMASYGLWNPFNFSAATQMGFAIAGSTLFGLVALAITGYILYRTAQQHKLSLKQQH